MTELEDDLLFCVDTEIPNPFVVGRGNALHLAGWCFHPRQRLRELEVLIDGRAHPATTWSAPRLDVFRHFSSRAEFGWRSYYSGFWATAPINECPAARGAEIYLQATLQDRTKRRRRIAGITLSPGRLPPDWKPTFFPPPSAEGPLVVICLATYCPPLELFRRQIESIIAQTHRNWICLVGDDGSPEETVAEIEQIIARDERFMLLPAARRSGFYRNFERCLSFTPEQARYVALADQDDFWYPRKLETLLARFGADTPLVFSDMRIVDERGTALADTYWTARRNNWTDLAALMMVNTVPGAGLMFRRELLDYVLPFPERVGDLYHDHWIGGVALAKGPIECVSEPLYDYTRHSSNISSYGEETRGSWPRRVYQILKSLMKKEGRRHAQFVYYEQVLRVKHMASVAALRCEPRLTPAGRQALRHLSAIDSSPAAFLWLVLRGIRDGKKMSVTNGFEYELLTGILWKSYLGLGAWFGTRRRKGNFMEGEN